MESIFSECESGKVEINLCDLAKVFINWNDLVIEFIRSTHIYKTNPELDKKIQKRFGLEKSVSGLEFDQRTALLLINTDSAVDFPEPLQPNMIQVGGLQISEPKPLKEVCWEKFWWFYIYFQIFVPGNGKVHSEC